MPSHQDRVRRNYCEHEWKTEKYAYNFLICSKCGGWLNENGESIYYPLKVDKKKCPTT